MEAVALTIKVQLFDEFDDECEHELPAKHEVCSRCEGYGTHLHPAIGGHAYTPEEFNEAFSEPEEREAYFARGGMYDVPCEECCGARVVVVVDESACQGENRALLEQYRKQERERAQSEAEDRATMRMECGGFGEY